MSLITLTILRAGSTQLTVIPENGSTHKRVVMGEDYLDVYFVSDTLVDLAIMDYIDIGGLHYHLNQLPNIRKVATNYFEYHCVFESYFYDLTKYVFMDTALQETDFELYGDAEDFLTLVTANLNRAGDSGNVYTRGTALSPSVYKTLRFTGVNVMEALLDICDAYGVEYEVNSFEISLVDRVATPATSTGFGFQYNPIWMDSLPAGLGGIREITREVLPYSNMATRIFGYGGTRNIPPTYGSERLRLKPDGYLDKNLSTYGKFERTVIFDDIYPRLADGVLTSVSADLITMYATTFGAIDYRAIGFPPVIHFNTGMLAGYEFPIDAQFIAYGVVTIGRIDEGGVSIPNADLYPQSGDKFVILNISLPAGYITAAEAELETAVASELEKYCYPKIKYSVLLDWQYMKSNPTIVLEAGKTVAITDTNLGLTAQEIRIIGMEQSLTNPYEYKLDLSDFLQRVLVNVVTSDIRSLKTGKADTKELKSSTPNYWKRDSTSGRLHPATDEDWVKIGVEVGSNGTYGPEDTEYGIEPANATLDVEGSTAISTVVLTKADEDDDTFLYVTTRHSVVHFDASGGALKPLLPLPSTAKRVIYRLICDNLDNTITISSVSGNVGSGATLTFGAVGQVFLLQSDSTNWNLINNLTGIDTIWGRSAGAIYPLDLNDYLGIGTDSPESFLDIVGSVGFAIETVTANTTLDGTHYLVRVDTTSNTVQITLPDPATCERRIYGVQAVVLTNRVNVYSSHSSINFTFLTVGQIHWFQSDGTHWRVVDRIPGINFMPGYDLLTITDWVTSTDYYVGSMVKVVGEGDELGDTFWFVCILNHTSTGGYLLTNATDLPKWYCFHWQKSGVSTFLALSDTPSSYSGQAGKAVTVNSTADALEFTDPGDSLELDPATATFSGMRVDFTAGENLVKGELCYVKSDGKLWKTDADALATCLGVAMATDTISADASGVFLLIGFMSGYSSLTVGGAVYASTSPGALTQTPVSGTDDTGQIVGVAVAATIVYFMPSLTTIERT